MRTGMIVVSLSGLLLAGCGASGAPVDTGPVAVPERAQEGRTAPKETTLEEADDYGYLSAVRANGSMYLNQISDEHLILAAKDVCASLDRGIPITQYENSISQEIKDFLVPQDIDLIIGAGIGSYCPEYFEETDKLSGEGTGSGVLKA